ncbi:hypothetical protein WD019_15080 [Fictibacillus sp. Mic-4]|uniref:LexA family protein n=1 Tax=Fictibacillus sp. Mic-4 TaxID=3132826 RepID=UPI003CEFEC6A
MLSFLEKCRVAGMPVEIIYMSDSGVITQRTISIQSISGSTIKAYCHLRRRTRTFKLENILGVNYRKKGEVQLRKISKRQQEILDLITNYIREYSFPPTVREICNLSGLRSTSTVHRHLEQLRKKGLITWEEGLPRTLRLIDQSAS